MLLPHSEAEVVHLGVLLLQRVVVLVDDLLEAEQCVTDERQVLLRFFANVTVHLFAHGLKEAKDWMLKSCKCSVIFLLPTLKVQPA